MGSVAFSAALAGRGCSLGPRVSAEAAAGQLNVPPAAGVRGPML